MFGSNVWGTIVGRAARVPVVVAHEQTWDYEGQPLRKLLDGRLIGRHVDAFVAVSTADRDRMAGLEGVPEDKLRVELNGYVPRTGPRPPARLREELGLPAIRPARRDRGDPAPAEGARRPARRLRARARACGPPRGGGRRGCRAALERRAVDLGIAPRTHFLGLRDDVDAILAAVDVAAMSSDFEGTPLFAFECMAAHTPLVATAVGGLPDMLEDGRSAILVAPRDPDALATAIDRLLGAPEQREALADAAAQQLQRYEIDAVAGRFADLYRELLERRR